MTAILFLRRAVRIYTLARGQSDSQDEVRGFLEGAPGSNDSAVKGMAALVGRIAREGTLSLPSNLFKRFRPRKGGPQLCELQKGDWRISAFEFPGQRLLLVDVYQKSCQRETSRYALAIQRREDFVSNPRWQE